MKRPFSALFVILFSLNSWGHIEPGEYAPYNPFYCGVKIERLGQGRLKVTTINNFLQGTRCKAPRTKIFDCGKGMAEGYGSVETCIRTDFEPIKTCVLVSGYPYKGRETFSQSCYGGPAVTYSLIYYTRSLPPAQFGGPPAGN